MFELEFFISNTDDDLFEFKILGLISTPSIESLTGNELLERTLFDEMVLSFD